MVSVKRFFQLCALSACLVSSTVAFADEAAVTASEAAPSLEEGIDFGNLGMPEPVSLACTATSQCTPVGGTPLTCTGSSSCSTPTAMSVLCDGTTTWCTCNPANVPAPCEDPQGFCACYTAAPWNWANCRQTLCQGA